ncbi:hypothetical protein MHU86_13491 [Fragilaria crotonensis]|nr:hypothetical protein MHU86_13491 [Fragilaria crotonensis]
MTLSEVSDGRMPVPDGPAIKQEAVATTRYPSSTNDPTSSSSSSPAAAAAAAAETTTTPPAASAAVDADIHKAIKFWTHPSLSTIPAMEKIYYLKSKGFSDYDIHRVWEKLIDHDDGHDDTIEDNDNINNSSPQTGVTVTKSPQQHRTPARNRNSDVRYRGNAGAAAYPTSTSTQIPPTTMQPQGEIVDHETSQTVALLTVGGVRTDGSCSSTMVEWRRFCTVSSCNSSNQPCDGCGKDTPVALSSF